MSRLVVIKRLGYEALAGWTTYDTGRAAFPLFQGRETHSKAHGKPIYGRISMGAHSGTQRQISSISRFVTPMHPSVQSSICEDYADKDNYHAHH
jgi:hypothetical protein